MSCDLRGCLCEPVCWFCVYRQECGALRQELSSRYDGDSRAALAKLAHLKDSAMEQASKKWEKARKQLIDKVV